MKGMLFDLPHVTEKAKQKITAAGLSGRCEVVAGDALVSVPSGGDGYILVISGGRERTAAEHRALLEKTGFTLTRIIPTQSEVSVIEAVPA